MARGQNHLLQRQALNKFVHISELLVPLLEEVFLDPLGDTDEAPEDLSEFQLEAGICFKLDL